MLKESLNQVMSTISQNHTVSRKNCVHAVKSWVNIIKMCILPNIISRFKLSQTKYKQACIWKLAKWSKTYVMESTLVPTTLKKNKVGELILFDVISQYVIKLLWSHGVFFSLIQTSRSVDQTREFQKQTCMCWSTNPQQRSVGNSVEKKFLQQILVMHIRMSHHYHHHQQHLHLYTKPCTNSIKCVWELYVKCKGIQV